MIQRLQIYNTTCIDPYFNIATEKYLMDTVPEGCVRLYLWQNKNTVVIGRNQNAWLECRTTQLEQEGGKLARRLSGGGAVFHDMGNLNFTFLVHQEDYDLDKQFSVIQSACRSLGIQVEKSGRNDLLAEGRKFSGNAFYHSGGRAYHHGTLLVDADMEKLSRYLTPPKAKLEAKGVSSVRSRVTNLKELCPGLTCDILRKKMAEAFGVVYGATAEVLILDESAITVISQDAQKFADWNWLYGPKLPFSSECQGRFDWGYIHVQLQLESGRITSAAVWSDAMDWELSGAVQNALAGCRFVLQDIQNALISALEDTKIRQDICSLLETQAL